MTKINKNLDSNHAMESTYLGHTVRKLTNHSAPRRCAGGGYRPFTHQVRERLVIEFCERLEDVTSRIADYKIHFPDPSICWLNLTLQCLLSKKILETSILNSCGGGGLPSGSAPSIVSRTSNKIFNLP